MSKLVLCKFLNADNEPRGREYTYNSEIDVAVGDYVLGEVSDRSGGIKQKRVVITKSDVNPEAIPGYESFKDKIKSVVGFAPADERTNNTDIPEIAMEDLE